MRRVKACEVCYVTWMGRKRRKGEQESPFVG
jgi:hypothetical protein